MSISRVYRLLSLITLLQSGRGYTARELARELEVSRRTIFRDLNMLEMAHIPYYHDPDSGGYRISRHFFLPPINLTLTEALAILMMAGRLRGAKRLPLLSHAAQAAMKVEGSLPKSVRDHVGSVLARLHVAIGPTARHEGLDAMFHELSGAIVEKRICRMVYISFHEKAQISTNVHPLRLAFLNRAWYLIAYSSKHDEVRTFKLGRIRKLTVTPRSFATPADVKLDEHFGSAWCMIPEGKLYDVHLRFARKVAGNVAEVRWHPSQRVQWHDDGSLDFHVTVDGLGEITWWILGYGDQVEVVAPPALRKRIAAIGRAVVRKHAREGP